MDNPAQAAYTASVCACSAFIMLMVAVCSAWTIWGSTWTGNYASFGMGPFVASSAYSPGNIYWWTSYVYWSDLNGGNVCLNTVQNNQMADNYGVPYGFCTVTSPPGAPTTTYSFALPSQIIGIQATTILAVIFSFFACIAGGSVSQSGEGGGYSAAAFSLLALIFSICAFAIWTTWGYSKACVSGTGCYIPVWGPAGLTLAGFTANIPQTFLLYYGGSFVVTVIAFICLVFSTFLLFGISNKLKRREDEGTFGAGI